MEGDTNQTAFDVNLYFVIPSKYFSEEECNEDMWDAYNKCPDWEVEPVWISEAQCLKMKPDKKDVFVMELFQGEAFKNLQTFKCIIIGPRCLLSCFLTGESIPEGVAPVFNTAMRGLNISASGFSGAIKNDIQRKVEYMGGIFTKQLRGSVTHLVTDNVMSAKYERATELGIKVVTVDWVNNVWETNLKESVPATDHRFDKFKCSIFLNLVVTSTNLSKRKKEEIKQLINSNGGEFMGILDGNKIKVVITTESSSLSDKLKYAMQNDLPCLKSQWVYDSLESGYAVPFKSYLIQSTQGCSTPEKSAAQVPLNFSTISAIPYDIPSQCIDETVSSSTTMSTTVISPAIRTESISKINYVSVIERLNIVEAKKAGPFLDGCNIYLSGFTANYRDKLNRILNVGSATRLDELSDALTHVIVGDCTKASQDLKIIKSKGLCPYILKVEWLEECIKNKAPVPEDNFIYDAKNNTQQAAPEPPSPLSKKNLQLLQRPKIPAIPLFDERNSKKESEENDEHSEIVQQYLQNTNSDANSSLREILKLPSNESVGADFNSTKDQTIAERWNNTTKRNNQTLNDRDESEIPISQESYISQRIFRGLIFIVSGFDADEYTQVITQIHGLGGKIVDKKYSGIPDYGIVPKFGDELKHTVSDIVTNLFIEDCIDFEKLVPIQYYHKPIIISKNIKPLTNCVISMSTYSGSERTYLSLLAEALGARFQDTFARKTNLQKNTYSSTHLVCPKPQGEKYNAAVKWKLPAVTAEWLLECAAKLKLVDETPYLVGETIAPENFQNSTIINNETSNERTKVNLAEPNSNQQIMGGEQLDTPIINKRLNNVMNLKTPKSPFHIDTPDTPYGQLFKDNPSPRTRKAWLRWIEHIPDLQDKESPPPKRRRSTPFSEVKRRAWAYVRGELDQENDETAVKQKEVPTTNCNNDEEAEPTSSHAVINRKLSFSDDDNSSKVSNQPTINVQIAQLDELLEKATPEARRTTVNCANKYQVEVNQHCLVKESQPESVGWEAPVKRISSQMRASLHEKLSANHESLEAENNTTNDNTTVSMEEEAEVFKPKFMLSGIKDKGVIEKLINDLGGEVSTSSSFDPTATHLLCIKPARNEKVLSSIASGKWILHYLYIEASSSEKKFLDEELYELGNPKSKGIIPDPSSDNEKTLVDAAYRWRLKLLNDKKGAFHNMVAMVIAPKEKYDQFVRLILAGGGIVVESRPPFDNSPKGKKINHCFIHKQNDKVEYAMMANKGITCFLPQYLNELLIAENPNPRDFIFPEFQKYLSLMPKKSDTDDFN